GGFSPCALHRYRWDGYATACRRRSRLWRGPPQGGEAAGPHPPTMGGGGSGAGMDPPPPAAEVWAHKAGVKGSPPPPPPAPRPTRPSVDNAGAVRDEGARRRRPRSHIKLCSITQYILGDIVGLVRRQSHRGDRLCVEADGAAFLRVGRREGRAGEDVPAAVVE